ncbi:hypothetical protein HK103_007195 [Boothiomyces macroporosus]|uniref:Acid phosphatase n=1 Tax=Boothiomyces macroporosus TaxID=261099 RepID=A0AAD5Y1K4_9FUNG|nr:hypothetical protein HK103_007195 [Boothiomyces macroporosus]
MKVRRHVSSKRRGQPCDYSKHLNDHVVSVPSMFNLLVPSLFALSSALPATSSFNNIFTIVLENESFQPTFNQPYFGKVLAPKGRLLTNYHGVTHPSQPNYIAMTSGSTSGVFLDFTADVDKTNVVDKLEAAQLTWKSYQESYPVASGCFKGDAAPYYRKHNPFASYVNIQSNPARCQNIVNANQLQADIAAGTLPNYMFYTPNINNDGHDTDLDYAANWLQGFIEPLLTNPVFSKTLFVVTFDESANFLDIDTVHNQIYTVLLGAGVPAGTQDNTYYNHYSILKTLETNWGIGSLTSNDAGANPFNLH